MVEQEVQRVLEASGFSRSKLPFKYLGIPICAKRISAIDCKLLVEKMTARIKSWSTRNLSFAGRSILIQSVLLSIHAYWSQIMILHKEIMSEIERVCTSFLWKGQSIMAGSGSVAWSRLCKPKKAGGIGFMSISEWNRAALIKNVWSIATKKDNLWVKWVHNVYIKHEEWWGYKAPPQSS